jgi:tetratricopeptide (TPR) repeat protein
MRFQGISLEELEELEQELLGLGETRLGDLSYSKIEVYDAMHSRLEELVKGDEDYREYYAYIKKKLVSYLLRYGMHTGHMTIFEDTENMLKKVLSYDPHNPIAAYRLGFLAYRSGTYSEAVVYLQQALSSQAFYTDGRFLLNAEQISRAVLYLTNSALHTAIQGEVLTTDLVGGPSNSASLTTQLCYNDGMLNSYAYRITTPFGSVLCSKEESGEEPMKDVLSLTFNKFGALLSYNGIAEQLTQVQANVLRYLLVKTRKGEAATPWSLKDYFLFTHVITGVPEETFMHVVSDVKQVMAEMEIPASIQLMDGASLGYYFDGSLPFTVIDRVDEELPS